MVTSTLTEVRKNIIGRNSTFTNHYGKHKIIYADFTGSNQAYKPIENKILNDILPYYANVHSKSAHNAKLMTSHIEQSRNIIRKSVNATKNDEIIFAGAGCTGAFHILFSELDFDPKKTTVFITPYEHHSTLIPWRESGVQLITIKEDKLGNMDLNDLEKQLKKSKRSLKIGCFNAGSNVTGILTDITKTTTICKKYNALVFFDYACAGSHAKINMHPTKKLSIDAIMVSPHKMLGGIGTTGILVANKKLFDVDKAPHCPGGGSVIYVDKKRHAYSKCVHTREESGTPNIIGCIRTGLTFDLKNKIGDVDKLEREYMGIIDTELGKIKNIVILKGNNPNRMPIYSILFFNPHNKELYQYNLIVTLLNDMYGIQTRGGVDCSGGYAQDLTNFSDKYSKECMNKILTGDNSMRIGWVRVSFSYIHDIKTVKYILRGIKDIAKNANKYMDDYKYNKKSNSWNYIGK